MSRILKLILLNYADDYLSKQYERIVLRPELTDADIQEAYIQCVKEIHTEFIETIRQMEGDLMNLLASETSHLVDPTSNNKNDKVILSLDWASQLQKIKNVPSNFEKTPELTVALSAGGAILGKTIGTAVAGKAAAGTVGTKVLGGKLASPFVTKVSNDRFVENIWPQDFQLVSNYFCIISSTKNI